MKPAWKPLSVVAAGGLLLAVVSPVAEAASSESASVSGTITDAASGDPVKGVCVSVRSTDRWWDERVCTDSSGQYSFGAKPGSYQLQFDPGDAYALQWSGGATTPTDAAWVRVRAGATVTGIDAHLVAGATMTGEAIEGDSGQPMRDACVSIVTTDGTDGIAVVNGVHRDWTIAGLPAGPLTVKVWRCDSFGARFTYAYDALTAEDATVFNLTPGATTDVGAVALVAGAKVNGKVTAKKSGAPLQGIQAALDWMDSRSGEPPLFGDLTNAGGRYAIKDVQPGVHKPVAVDRGYPPAFAPQWAGRAASYGAGTSYDLAPGEKVRVNFRLVKPGTITGVLPAGAPGLLVDAFTADYPEYGLESELGWGTELDAAGKFTILGLPAGDILVAFGRPWYDPDGFWFDGVRDVANATTVPVRPGKATRISGHLPPPA